MAYTKKQQAYQKRRYRTDKKYRDSLIKSNTEKHKKNRSKYAKKSKEYYHSNPDYRKNKLAKMREYNKKNRKKNTSEK